MPLLNVALTTDERDQVIAGEFAVTATFSNRTDQPAQLNLSQASRPSLVLEVQDSHGVTVLMRPPDAPTGTDEPDLEIEPGDDLRLEYMGFLDRDKDPGNYRVRYVGRFAPLGGSPDDPLISEWVEFRIVSSSDRFPMTMRATPHSAAMRPLRRGLLGVVPRLWRFLLCWIARRPRRAPCEGVPASDFEEVRTEVMTDAPPGYEAWNGTYQWHARFHLSVDRSACRATATVRIRLVGTLTPTQQTAWQQAIEAAWSHRFKLCSTTCCCLDGHRIVGTIEFVGSGEDQVVNVGDDTTSMGHWGRNDTTAVSHEFGHMLGALDEYYTINGTPWGPGYQSGAGIMNNPAATPFARHYDVVEHAAEALLATPCSTVSVTSNC